MRGRRRRLRAESLKTQKGGSSFDVLCLPSNGSIGGSKFLILLSSRGTFIFYRHREERSDVAISKDEIAALRSQ